MTIIRSNARCELPLSRRLTAPLLPSVQQRVRPRLPPSHARLLPGAGPVPRTAAGGGALRDRMLPETVQRRPHEQNRRQSHDDLHHVDNVDRGADPHHHPPRQDVQSGRPGGVARGRRAGRRETLADAVRGVRRLWRQSSPLIARGR